MILRLIAFVTTCLLIFSPHSFASCDDSLVPEHYRADKDSQFRDFIPKDEDGMIISTKEVPLTTKNILDAYAHGSFPWNPTENGIVKWYNPREHGVVDLAPIIARTNKKGKSLTKAWKFAQKNAWTITFNKAYEEVVEACKTHKRSNYSHVWLTDEVKAAFLKLYDEGHAHSVEVWDKDGNLVGGTYGIYQNGVFSAESMFHRENGGGKVAVIALAERLYATGHTFIDSQTVNANTRENYYAYPLKPEDYLQRLRTEKVLTKHISAEDVFSEAGPFRPSDLTPERFEK